VPDLIDADAAIAHLAAHDPTLGAVIARVGPYAMRTDGVDDPFQALSRSIVYQQLSGKAAGTILGRFVAVAAKGGTFPTPLEVLALSDEEFRGAGMSRQKTAALRSLAEHFADGELGATVFHAFENEAVIERLTAVRGIGRWTAEMFLMFHLRRADVLPVNDVGINRAIMRLYGLAAMPKPAEVQRIGAPWHPHATVACWYLWRSEDVRLLTEEQA
jgi:3-methyladenine DNA glycosylase/8-oxoguanine DNA glycosylase